jgi:uncharacterized membrane protein YuzA (DUF378 family)
LKSLNVLALVLVVVGGLNWGLVGLLKLDLVAYVLGAGSLLANAVYVLVGVSAVYVAVTVLPKTK